MPGEPLMCVWDAAHILQKNSSHKQPLKAIIRDLCLKIAALEEASIHANGSEFDDKNPGKEISFSQFVQYVRRDLFDSTQSFPHFVEAIEKVCWQECQRYYEKKAMKERYGDGDTIFKLWQVFNRLSYAADGSPVVKKSDIQWLILELVRDGTQTNINVDIERCIFTEFLDNFARWAFPSLETQDMQKRIVNCHTTLVQEVTMVGWLHKRTSKRSSKWKPWTKRWFQLSASGLTYYSSPSCRPKDKKGRFSVNSLTIVHPQTVADKMFQMNNKKYRLIVSNKPFLDLQIADNDAHSIDKWKRCIEEVKTASEEDTTVMTKCLQDRDLPSKQGDLAREKLRQGSKIVRIKQEARKKYESGERTESMEDDKSSRASGSSWGSSRSEEVSPKCGEDVDSDLILAQKHKLKAVFVKLDKNPDGFIDFNEFQSFVKECGLDLSEEDVRLVFRSIDSNSSNTIDFDELSDYFLYVVFDDELGDNRAATSLRTAFNKADRDSEDCVNFKEFTEIAKERQRSMRVGKLLDAFNSLEQKEGDGVAYSDVRKHIFGKDTRSDNARRMVAKSSLDTGINKYLQKAYDNSNMEDLAKYIRERWAKFSSFKRPGKNGEVVMSGSSGMVSDIFPGTYNLLEIACFTDLTPIEPFHCIIDGVQWISQRGEERGKLIFPASFSGRIPTQIATSETLRYYGCSLAEDKQVKISLMYRHGVQDFTYSNQYLDEYVLGVNGAGLETHGFSHLDCPLDIDSGYFILGKMVESCCLHLTAFEVPMKHTVYVPPNVIHSNDYMRGTWRTMLSDACGIDHVQLMKPDPDKDNQLAPFSFSFSWKL